jgi:hypothetical protein
MMSTYQTPLIDFITFYQPFNLIHYYYNLKGLKNPYFQI